MPPIDRESEFETKLDSFKNVSGDGTTAANTDLAVVEVEHKAQLTSLTLTGAAVQIYDVVVRDQDGTNSSVVKSFVGDKVIIGEFDNPVVRNIGAQREVAVINRDQLTDSDYAVNLEVDQLERGREG